jgi:hypothetical protein
MSLFSNSTLAPSFNSSIPDTVDSAKSSLRAFLWAAAGIATVLCWIVSFMLIRKHLMNWTRPREQRKIVGILWLAPIFAFDSFLSLSFPSLAPTTDLLKEMYEGYTVYLFFSLMVEYLGGEARAAELIKQRLEPLYRPFPLNKICTGPLTNDAEKFVTGCKRGVMQFVIVRPTMAIISAILYINDLYTKGDFSLNKGYIYIGFINNVSVSWAVYCLFVFFLALRRPLGQHNPVPKFVAIKAVVFLSFWQGVLLALFARFHVIREAGSWTSENVTTGIHDLLICFEMLLAAFYHRIAFPWEIYDRGRISSIASVGFDDNFALSDARRDFAEIMPHTFFASSPKPVPVHHANTENEKAIEQDRMDDITGKRKDVIIEGEQPLLREDD